MKYPILYESNATDFFTLGLGPLSNTLKATVTEERNGAFYFEAEILVDNPIFPLVLNDCIIKADAGHLLKDQRFRIKRIVPKHNGRAEIYAEHVSYLSAELAMQPDVSVNGSASVALNTWKSSIIGSNPFIVDSDIQTSNSTRWRIDRVENPRQALGGVEGSILDVWGGEYRFDNYRISLLQKRGTTANTILSYGRNITDFEQEQNIMNTFTSVYPYAIYTDENEQEHIVTIDNKVVDSEHAGNYPNKRVQPVDFSDKFEYGSVPSKAQLQTLAEQYIVANNIGVPKTSIKVSFLDLSKSADYSAYQHLEEVNLCDDVRVHYPKLGVNTVAKVIRVVWNVLTESYDEIEIGEKRVTLASKINEQSKEIKEISTQANYTMISADGKNIIYYGLYGQDGLGEPTATKIGDSWYKPDGEFTELRIWNGTIWKFIMSTKENHEIQEAIKEIEDEIVVMTGNINTAVDNANQAVIDANFAKDQVETATTLATNANQSAQDAVSQSSQAHQLAVQSATDASTALNTATGLLGRMDSAEGVITDVQSSIDDITGELAHKVNVTAYNQLEGTVNSHTGLISANSQQIELKANQSMVDTLQGRVSSAEGQISVQAGQIANRLTASEVNSLVDGKGYATQASVNSQVSRIDGDINSWSSQLQTVEGKVDGIEVGGRNWFAINRMPDSEQYIVPGVYGFEYQLELNTTYTASITEGTGSAPIYFYIPSTEVPNQYVTSVRPNRPRTITTDESGIVVIGWSNSGGFSFNILKDGEKNLTITKGTKAADWMPAPEDMATVSQLTTNVNQINQTITDTNNSIQLLTQTVQNQGGSISSISSSLSVETGRINALNTKTNGHETQIGSLQSSYSGLQSTVAQVENSVADITNIFKDSKFELSSGWTLDGTGWTTSNNTGAGRVWTNNTGQRNRFYFSSASTLQLEVGRYYDIKFKANTGSVPWELEVGTSVGENLKFTVDGTTRWYTGTIHTTNWTAFSFWVANGMAIRIHELYVYESVASTSTQAYSDFQQTVSGIQTTVATKANQSQVTQLSNQITSVVSDVNKRVMDYRYYTTSTSSEHASKWFRILRSTIGSQYLDTTLGLNIIGTGSGDAVVRTADLFVRIKQQAAMGSVPTVELGLLDLSAFNADDFIAVLRANSSTQTIVDVYVRNRWSYTVLSVEPYNVLYPERWQFIDGEAPQSSPPSGTRWYATRRGNLADIYGAQSQITQLATDINLRVTKNDVINQINISTEGILIAGNKVRITGQTSIDNGVIKRAMIGDLEVSGAKIADATIASAKIISLDANKITANALSAISANLGTITGGSISGTSFYNSGADGDMSIANGRIRARDFFVEAEGSLTSLSSYVVVRSNSSVVYLQSNEEVRATKVRSVTEYIDFRAGRLISQGDAYIYGSYQVAANGLFQSNTGYVTLRSLQNQEVYLQGSEVKVVAPSTTETYRNIAAANFIGRGGNTAFSTDSGYTVVRSSGDTQPVYVQGNEIRATRVSNAGTYIPVRASAFPTGSLAEYKQDIIEHTGSALEVIKSAKIYDYRLRDEVSHGIDKKRTGLVIGHGYATPKEVIDGDGVEQYLMNSYAWKAIQELDTKVVDEMQSLRNENMRLTGEIGILKMEVQSLRQLVA